MFKPSGFRGTVFVQRRGGSLRGIALNTERRQTALRGRAPACSQTGTASPLFPLEKFGRRASETSPCRRAGNANRRARPPQSSGERPGRRRGNRDPRALLVWPGCLPRRLQLVFTRSSGRNSLCLVAQSRLVQSRSDSFGFDVSSSVTGPGANPTLVGSDVCRSETYRVEALQDNLVFMRSS